MKLQHQFSENEYIQIYIEQMAEWIVENTDISIIEIETMMTKHKSEVMEVFNPFPETIFHFDPSKFAEMLAINWNLIKKPLIQFV
ncbi:hypothetical protein J9303_00185 [Bacillaceae bacterium Marseille-Q3522]|nr:hypothetical protein [Bacillaceae bacterium Marseille-Q3522]